VHTERIPVERTITDYYAVETQIEYIPKEIEETIVEYEPVERTWERVQYLPVETQIIHYPEREKYVAGQSGRYVQAGYTTGSQAYTTTAVTTKPVYQTVYSGSQYATTTPQYAYQTTTTGPQTNYQAVTTTSQYGSSSGVPVQSYTSGPLDTSTYTAGYTQQQGGYTQQQGGYAQQQGGYTQTQTVQRETTVQQGSQVKNNTSYATNI
jgi:hypothetical protein